MARIFPSLISADLVNLANVVATLEPHCAGFHIDIMDNHFVPNLTWGHQFANAIAKISHKKQWVHLMVQNPDSIIKNLTLTRESIISFHAETTDNIAQTVKLIRDKNYRPSIVLNPKVSADTVFDILHQKTIDHVLVMSVEPGFSGQTFLTTVESKIDTLVAYKKEKKLEFTIGIDGGVTLDNILPLAQKGVDDFAIASAIFTQPNPLEALHALTHKIEAKK